MYSQLKANISYPLIRTRMSAMMGEPFFLKVSTRKTFGHDIIKLFKNIWSETFCSLIVTFCSLLLVVPLYFLLKVWDFLLVARGSMLVKFCSLLFLFFSWQVPFYSLILLFSGGFRYSIYVFLHSFLISIIDNHAPRSEHHNLFHKGILTLEHENACSEQQQKMTDVFLK